MAYNKTYDVMPLEDLIKILTDMTDDGEYKLSKVKSPKSKRLEVSGLKYNNSLLGCLIKLQETTDQNQALKEVFSAVACQDNMDKIQEIISNHVKYIRK